jgi:DNA polymerase type B, organellar and viral.
MNSKKEYFPHFFNTSKNQNYIGPIPDVKYHGVDTMEKTARKMFLEWHAAKVNENYVFDFQKEFLEYCDSDVDILRRGCLELKKQFLEMADIDPFQYITIAGVCMAIYRSKYLQPKTIALKQNNKKIVQ